MWRTPTRATQWRSFLRSTKIRGHLFNLAIVALLAGCAFENKSLTQFDRSAGYRLPNTRTSATNTDEVFVVLAFSGGGTRAAAFSYGVMKQLALIPISYGGTKRRLLDEVDIISSVSGGSFTSAYYALYRDRLFQDFENDFLNKNVEFGLLLRVLNPLNWPRLASPYFDRIDLAAEYYDSLLYRACPQRALTHARPAAGRFFAR
jgi:NTE family protein